MKLTAWLFVLFSCSGMFLLAACTPTTAVRSDQSAEPLASSEVWQPSKYRLAVGDRVKVDVFREPDLSVEATLDAAGMINYPLLGLVRAADLTARDLEIVLTRGLTGDYLKNPDVRVVVTRFRPVFVTGAVRSAGSYPFTDSLTVEKAIALAGGLTQLASQRRIYVLRDGSPTNARERAVLDTPLFPGDTLLVEEGIF